MKLYTKRGDGGLTSLFDGSEVRKDDLRVAAYGTVDELNACLGVVAALAQDRAAMPQCATLRERTTIIQSELFTIGADLATPVEAKQRQHVPVVSEDQIHRLESWIDDACESSPPLDSFVLPGGDLLAAQLHVGRTVCRRAERCTVTLAAHLPVNTDVIIYLNRLSDLLFAWARWINHAAGVADVAWINPKRSG